MASELAAALITVQQKLKPIKRTATGQRSKYPDLATVHKAVFPLLAEQKLAFIAKPTIREDGRFVLAYSLIHAPSGETQSGEYPMHDGNAQQQASDVTYARRYALMAVTGAVAEGEDDDGQKASEGHMDRVKTAWQDPEHTRLTQPSPEERVNGRRQAERRRSPDPDDPWAGELPQDAPGSISTTQRSGVMANLSKLGIKGHDDRVKLLADIVGLPVESTNDLSYNQAAAVMAELKDRLKVASS